MPLVEYTKNAAEVNALRWAEDKSNTLSIITDFFASVVGYDAGPNDPFIRVETPYGVISARPGDWFLKDEAENTHIFTDDNFNNEFTIKP